MSVLVALAVNVVLLAGLASSAQTWRVSAHPQRHLTWVTAVATAGAPAPAEPTRVEPLAASNLPVPAPAATRAPARAPVPVPTQPTTPPREDPPTAAAPQPGAMQGGRNEVRFYTYGEVDQAAEPDSDWNLDAALLDGAGVKQLAFEVFISATGEVVACTILRPAELPADTRRLLEDRLRHAALRPAIRAGMAVPSVRRIELSVE